MKCLLTLLAIGMGWTIAMAQPENDLIENAIDLGHGPLPYEEEDVDFVNATNTNDNTPAGTGCALSQPGIWYKFTATQAGSVGAGIILPDNPVIVFFEGPAEDVTSGMQLVYVDQPNNSCAVGSTSGIETTPGTTYYIYMKNNVASDIIINTAEIFEVPENDLIENAIDLSSQAMPFVDENIHFLMVTDTNDGGQNDCDTGNAIGVWYKITAQQNGQIDANLSTDENSTVIFYSAENDTATSGTDLTFVDQPLNNCGIGDASSIDAEAGVTYYLMAASLQPYVTVTVDASLVLSTAGNNPIEFNYYPNPVRNVLNIESKNTLTDIHIYSLTGQEVFYQKILDTQTSVPLGTLEPGMYLATVSNEEQTSTFKLIKK